MSIQKKNNIITILVLLLVFGVYFVSLYINSLHRARGENVSVEPGSDLMVRLRIVNTKITEGADLKMMYSIRNSEGVISLTGSKSVHLNELSVANEGITIPETFIPGNYTADVLVAFSDQEHPAISKMSFRVEKKYFGFYRRNWIIASPLIIIPFVMYYLYRKKQNKKPTNG